MITSVSPGSYRTPLVAGLRQLKQDQIADAVQNGDIKLGNTSQMRSNDRALPELKDVVIQALATEAALKEATAEVCGHYRQRLTEGACYVANPGPPLRIVGQETYAPGELFLKS